MKKQFLFYCLLITGYICADMNLKKHEQWWEVKCKEGDRFNQFAEWIGGPQELSRIAIRKHIHNQNYHSILDIPCGLCIDYMPLTEEIENLSYIGIDITQSFVSRAQSLGISVINGRIQEIPFPDSSFEVTYSRHILEHLDSYETALRELIRVAQKEVLVVFFIIPIENDEDIIITGPVDGYPIYHNRYSRKKIEYFLSSISKVKSFSWQSVANTSETILHIFV